MTEFEIASLEADRCLIDQRIAALKNQAIIPTVHKLITGLEAIQGDGKVSTFYIEDTLKNFLAGLRSILETPDNIKPANDEFINFCANRGIPLKREQYQGIGVSATYNSRVYLGEF